MSDLAAALQIAIRVHAGQVDKQGEPYLLHVLRVVEAVHGGAEKVVAALHDVAEDSDVPVREIALEASLGTAETQALALLTRDENETYRNYIFCLAEGEWIGGEIAREVKLADLRDNLGRIPEPPPFTQPARAYREWEERWKGLKARYEKAIETLEGASGMLASHPDGTGAADTSSST
jgi:hypothetical protein